MVVILTLDITPPLRRRKLQGLVGPDDAVHANSHINTRSISPNGGQEGGWSPCSAIQEAPCGVGIYLVRRGVPALAAAPARMCVQCRITSCPHVQERRYWKPGCLARLRYFQAYHF